MQLSVLRDQVKTYFNKTELRNLCFDLGISHEELSGDSIEDQARELVDYCRRHGLVVNLIKRCQELRPHINWQDKSTINSLLQSDTTKASPSTLMEALSHEISSNLISVQEFLNKEYRVVGERVCSQGKDTELIYLFSATSLPG